MTEKKEELWNVVTHLAGFLFSLLGGGMLIYFAASSPMPYGLTSVVIFILSMALLYLASTAYHFFIFKNGRESSALKRFDHIAIYFLIAGTYTPFTLLLLKDGMGWMLLIAIWTLAIVGTIFKIFFLHRYEWISLIFYILMGWLVLVDITNLIALSPQLTLLLLMGGGISYTIGTIFYANRNIPFNHAIWHIFVLGGSILHFSSIYTLL